MSLHLLDGDQMGHRVDHAPDLGTVLVRGHVPDPLQTEGTQRLALVLLAADAGLDLADLEPRHQCTASWRAFSRAAGVTSPTDLPRRRATGSGCSRPCSASTVACTTLMALAEPRDLASTSCTPAHSSTARADPPAMTP